MKVSEFIEDCRDQLHMGWTKGEYHADNGDVCILGALDRMALKHLAEDGVRVCAKAKKAIEQTAWEMFPEFSGESIPSINDHYQTTKDDVLAVLDKTSLKLAEAGE